MGEKATDQEKSCTDLLIDYMEEFSHAEAKHLVFAFIDDQGGLVARRNCGRAHALGIVTAAAHSLAAKYYQ